MESNSPEGKATMEKLTADPVRKRGRPRKNFSVDNHHCLIQSEKHFSHEIRRHSMKPNSKRIEQSKLSEYELLNMRRREEVLSMFRFVERFHVKITLK